MSHQIDNDVSTSVKNSPGHSDHFLIHTWLFFTFGILICFNVTTASTSLQKPYKSRQYHVVIRQMLASSTGNMVITLLLTLTFWPYVDHTIMFV